MRCILITPLLLMVSIAISQYPQPKEIDMFASDIEKNVFRLTLMAYDDIYPFTFSYEREIIKPFTVVLKAGPSFESSNFDPVEYSINAFASGELRYYYNLRRRIRKQKTVRNFSANYLSLEHSILSDPIAVINQSRSDAMEGSRGLFVNIGYQKQFKQAYFNVFLGAKINVDDFKEGILSADTYHYGIAFGIVLFE